MHAHLSDPLLCRLLYLLVPRLTQFFCLLKGRIGFPPLACPRRYLTLQLLHLCICAEQLALILLVALFQLYNLCSLSIQILQPAVQLLDLSFQSFYSGLLALPAGQEALESGTLTVAVQHAEWCKASRSTSKTSRPILSCNQPVLRHHF